MLLPSLGAIVALTIGAAQAPPAAGRVTGRVVVEGTNAPIAGARVTLSFTEPGAAPTRAPSPTVTGENGLFAFEAVAPGKYSVLALKAGYVPLLAPYITVPQGHPGADIQLAAGQHQAIDLQLQRGAAITGRVLDSSGQPAPDVDVMAVVRASNPSGKGSLLVGLPPPGQHTNDAGEFRVSSLPAGEYFIAAMPRPKSTIGSGAAAESAQRIAVTTFYPGVVHAAAARAVTVARGETVNNVDFVMQSSAPFRVSGVVVDPAGFPVSGALVSLAVDPNGGEFGDLVGTAQTNASGMFVIAGVPSGHYQLHVSSAAFAVTNVVVTDGDVSGVRVTVRGQAR